MKHRLVVIEGQWEAFLAHLLKGEDERMAFAYCGRGATAEERQFLVRMIDLPADEEYRAQGPAVVTLKAEHAGRRAVRAQGAAALLQAHSHPFTTHPSPSRTDDEGAVTFVRVMRDLAPGTALIRLVIGSDGSVWGAVESPEFGGWAPLDEIVVLGPARRRVVRPLNAPSPPPVLPRRQDERTAAVLGQEGVASVRDLAVAVVGVGGTGSAVVAQLRGHVDQQILIDPDVVEAHNAPRLYHYADGDEGQPKVKMHEREIRRAFPHARVLVRQGHFPAGDTLELVKRADIIFCCPDHNAVRYAVAQVGARFLKPVIEIGCGGFARGGQLVSLGYHVKLQVPGGICLACSGMDLSELEDPASTASKRAAGYIVGGDLVAGQLVPLTTRAAADAVDIFFRYVTGYASPLPHHLFFDALRFLMVDASEAYRPRSGCTICGGAEEDGIVAAGDHPSRDQRVLSPEEVHVDAAV